MRKLLSMVLVVALSFGNVSVTRAADEPTDNEKAIAIIDGFIQEMEELGYESFNGDVLKKELTDSYLWEKRLWNAEENILINGRPIREMQIDYFFGGGNIYFYHTDAENLDTLNDEHYRNYYYYYYSRLLFIEELIEGKSNISLKDVIDRGKKLNEDYNNIDNYMWLREVGYMFNFDYFKYNLYDEASKTYIWDTLRRKSGECTKQFVEKYIDGQYKYVYTTKSERLDDFIKCLELLNDELENPFMQAMTVNVKVDKTAYDKYTEQKLNVTPAKSSNNSTTTSKTNTTTNTDNKVVVNVSVAGKKVSNMKVVAKKGKIKVVFAAMQNATKYQIQVATNKKFKKALKYTVTKPTKTIKKLKRNKVYYVRVRAISGKTKSKWVKKKIRTK